MRKDAGIRHRRGRKPVVASRNQDSARANIQAKLNVLARIVASLTKTTAHAADDAETRESILRHLPSSARQFNAWTAADLPPELRPFPLRVNAQQTLKKSGLLDAVETTTGAIKQLILEPVTPSKQQERLAGAIRRAKLAEELRAIAEREVVSLKRALADSIEQVKDLEGRLASLTQEAASRVAALEADLRRERKVRAVRHGNKVAALHQVNRAPG